MDVHNKNQILNHRLSNLKTELILIDHGLCPDWSRGPHKRMRDSIYLILDGQGKITINGESIYPTKNDMVLIPKGTVVSLYSENETCYNKYWCDFIMHIDGISLFEIIDFPYLIKPTNFPRALQLFDTLDKLHLNDDVASAFMIKSALFELMAMFLKYDTREHNSKVKDDPFADTIKGFINTHISEHLSVKVLAKETSFNEKYFIEVFKKHFGTTPAQYIKRVRLESAKQQLLYSDKKVVHIATNIGYSSLQKLSVDFKVYTGFSPSEFRKRLK